MQAEAANEAQRGGIEQAKGQWWASRAALASGFTVPPSGLSGASAVLDAFRDRSMVVAGENRRARDQCADHECQRYDLSCHSIPRMATLCDLGARPAAPRPHAGCERGLFPFVDVEVSRFVRGGSGTVARQCSTCPQRFSGCDLQIG